MSSATTPPDSDPSRRRQVHNMLKMYYGLNEEGKCTEQAESLDPCDINGPHFDPEIYLNKVQVRSDMQHNATSYIVKL